MQMLNNKRKELDIIIPISLELDWPTEESTLNDILELNEKYGFTKFALACPCGGWRSVGYPPIEFFRERAELFKRIKEALTLKGIICGWWNTLTVKSGRSEEFIRMVRSDGSLTPFASCPLDPGFRRRLSSDIALFAKIAKPAFIITEDDFSIQAATGREGCFCQYHLNEFAKRIGKKYTREELIQALNKETKEGFALKRKWRELMKDSLVMLSQAIREAVDIESPEIPIGYMQAGSADAEGDCTEAVTRAMAGSNHLPFSRICGTFYGGVNAKNIPITMYHPLYCRQHIEGRFHFLHESDTFPHTRFFTSGAHMRAMMGAIFSFNYDGCTFQVQQLVNKANEETAYGRMFATERKRFNEVANIASQCQVKGAELSFDPFWDMLGSRHNSEWLGCVSRFGIPYTSLDSNIAFWDANRATYADDSEIKARLSRGLFLDGNAAKVLCQRGYSRYLGAEIGENVARDYQVYDLGEREIIRDEYIQEGKGSTMPSAHMLAVANGVLLEIKPSTPDCEVLSDAYTFQKKYLGAAMSRYINELGGHVVIMGLTLEHNLSQALYNYRRQRLIQDMLIWCGDEIVFVREAPDVFTIMNEAVDPEDSGFIGMITLINLCEDELDEVTLHLPRKWQGIRDFKTLEIGGRWRNLSCHKVGNDLLISENIGYLKPMYILGSINK